MALRTGMKDFYQTPGGDRWVYDAVGEGPPVLWLHGFTGSHRSWESIVPYFQSRYRCISVDFLGHGESDAPTESEHYRMGSTVEALHELMSHTGYSSYRCVGYSMGGRVALSLAVAYPEAVTQLVVESASPGLATKEERANRVSADERLAESILAVGVPSFVEGWERIPLFQSQWRCSEATLSRQRAIRLAQKSIGLAGSLRGIGTGAQPSLWLELSDLPMPVLLVTGDEDRKFTNLAAQMVARIPEAFHHIVGGSGHAVHIEQPEAYVRILDDFFNR